jgi:hypothetical protein
LEIAEIEVCPVLPQRVLTARGLCFLICAKTVCDQRVFP